MKLPNSHLTLRSRFILWQLVVLTPLMLAWLLHQQYLVPRFTNPLNEIVQEITAEVLQVKSLQLALHRSAAPVNDYLIHGGNHEIDDFNRQRDQVDEIFTATRSSPFGEPQEQERLQLAWEEWQEAKYLAVELLGAPDPMTNPNVSAKMERFDRHIENASERLEELYNLAYHEIEEEKASAGAAHKESRRLSVIAAILALSLSLLFGSLLARSILLSVRSLHEGASQMASGRFDQQVFAGGTHELKELAKAFNIMAAEVRTRDAELHDQAIHDALTGLGNRRALNHRLREELQRAHRYQHPIGVLMLDIDHFKRVNDTYGHPAGDAVLQLLANVLRETIRPIDRVFRYGGEEFVIVSPETTVDGALSLAERIRKVTANTPFPLPDYHNTHITISIGVATYPSISDDANALLAGADKALYTAKENGRNRVSLYSSQVKEEKTK